MDLLVWRAGGVPVAATGEQIRRGALGVEGGHSVRLQGEQVLPLGEPGAVGRRQGRRGQMADRGP